MMSLHDAKSPPDGQSDTPDQAHDGLSRFLSSRHDTPVTSADSFVQLAGMSDLYEIQAGQIAIRRSQRRAIRAFAKQMIADHSMTNEELRAMAGAMPKPTAPPSSLDELYQALIDDLNRAPDGDFDTRYLAQQEAVDSVTVALLAAFRDRGDDSALRELCSLALPVIEHHREMTRQIRAAH